MKNFTKFLSILFLGLAFSVSAFSQTGVSADASATATIVTPLVLNKTVDMSFGNLAVNSNAGTVVLPAAAAPVRTNTGGVTLMPGGTITAAAFTLTGVSGAAIAVTLPADGVVVLDGPGSDMPVNTFTTDAPATLTGGSITFYVGATLVVAGSQTAGTYNSPADFTVTVNYN